MMVGVEALLRWRNAELGLVAPSEFIPFAEISGLIFDLGKWVLQTACIQARTWELAGYRDLKMAVNISGKQLKQPGFLEMIEEIIRETEITPESLELEFTESVIMEKADKTLMSLKNMGVHLSIDDFGTGYSSLSYLKHFPIDRIKIDRSFITDINHSNDDAAIVEAIISMAHSLNLKVIAEGVENISQMDFLVARGCDEMQGFYLGEPMPPDQLIQVLEDSYSRNHVRHFAADRLKNMPLSSLLPEKTVAGGKTDPAMQPYTLEKTVSFADYKGKAYES
jgi:EAL domain-containing protein (putative c-di-GMP-specific phosphodiesterase class I)